MEHPRLGFLSLHLLLAVLVPLGMLACGGDDETPCGEIWVRVVGPDVPANATVDILNAGRPSALYDRCERCDENLSTGYEARIAFGDVIYPSVEVVGTDAIARGDQTHFVVAEAAEGCVRLEVNPNS